MRHLTNSFEKEKEHTLKPVHFTGIGRKLVPTAVSVLTQLYGTLNLFLSEVVNVIKPVKGGKNVTT